MFSELDSADRPRAWDTWRGTAEAWRRAALRSALSRAPVTEASRDEVISALSSRRHVIILVAHADGERLYLPEPEPSGSVVSGDDIRSVREQIAANRPLVYLLACKTGVAEQLGGIMRALLESGAAGVVAPRGDLREDLGRDLLMALGHQHPSLSAIEVLAAASKQSRCTDMETYVP